MASINITQVRALAPKCLATEKISLEIHFNVLQVLEEDMELKMFFIWSTKNDKLDQELDAVDIGPLKNIGNCKILMEGSTPDFYAIPRKAQLDVSAIYIAASYRGKEFCRIGYYVKHSCIGLAEDDDGPPVLDINQVERSIDVQNPLVTHWDILWDSVLPENNPFDIPIEEAENAEGEVEFQTDAGTIDIVAGKKPRIDEDQDAADADKSESSSEECLFG